MIHKVSMVSSPSTLIRPLEAHLNFTRKCHPSLLCMQLRDGHVCGLWAGHTVHTGAFDLLCLNCPWTAEQQPANPLRLGSTACSPLLNTLPLLLMQVSDCSRPSVLLYLNKPSLHNVPLSLL